MADYISPILASNNDGQSVSGGFYWGFWPRIKKDISQAPTYALLTAGSNTSGTCDLYLKCDTSDIATQIYPDGSKVFPNLKLNDEIQSSPDSYDYNCCSWAGGRTDLCQFFNPAYQYSPNNIWYDPRGDKQSYDNFFGNVNAAGLQAPRSNDPNHSFTYIPTTESSQSLIDVWSSPPSPPYHYTHFSVKKPSDNWFHGYDWESKPGNCKRTFHPRHALNGSTYGDIVQYYKIAGAAAISMSSQNIAGEQESEPIALLANENTKLKGLIANVSSEQKAQFAILYQAWKATWTSPNLIMQSFPQEFFKSKEFQNLSFFCRSIGSSIAPLLLEKSIEGDELAGMAICELKLFENVDEIMVKTRMESPQGKISSKGLFMVDTRRSGWIRFARNVLHDLY
jgi:hypothetical protein